MAQFVLFITFPNPPARLSLFLGLLIFDRNLNMVFSYICLHIYKYRPIPLGLTVARAVLGISEPKSLDEITIG